MSKNFLNLLIRKKPTNESTKFQNSSYLCDLPILVIDFILDHLSYEDLINLKRTCKQLRIIIDQRKFKKLIIFIHGYPCFKNLFFTDELVQYSNSLQIRHLTILKSIKFKSNFKELKKLSIYRDPPTVIDELLLSLVINLKDLNSYDQLEHLELKIGKVKGKLNLKNLKICFIQTKLESKFELNCEQLKALAILHYAKPKLTNSTENLTYLHIDSINDSMIQIHKFTNLSTISCGLISTFRQIIRKFNNGLLFLKELKNIRILDWASSYFDNNQNLINELKLFEQNSHTNQIQIFLNDQNLNSNDLVEILDLIKNHDVNWKYFGCIQKNDLEFMVENSKKLGFLNSFVRKLTLNGQIKIQDSLIHQLKRIELKNLDFLVLQSNDERLIELFFEFWIQKWYKIRILELKISLKPNQYNLISIHFLNLKNLILDFKPDCFDFVVKMKNLEILQLRNEAVSEIKKVDLVYLFENSLFLSRIDLKKQLEFNFQICKKSWKNYLIKKTILNENGTIKNEIVKRFSSLNSTLDYYFNSFKLISE